MNEQRRHHRIRFNHLPTVRIGQFGLAGSGELESLSLGGCMVRSSLALRSGEAFGCEFSVFGLPLVDVSAVVVSKIGDLFGARFQAGPISERLIQESMDFALAHGAASILSINDLQGRKVMRVVGGLTARLRNDFLHSLAKMGIDDLDLSGVTDVDGDGLSLCRIAVEEHRVGIVRASACMRAVMTGNLALGDL